MATVYVADATAILGIVDHVPRDKQNELFDRLTSLVEDARLRFPSAVSKDLTVLARFEQVTSWSQGLGSKLRNFSPEFEHILWLMRILASEFGYTEGVVDTDGKEPSIVAVASYVRQIQQCGQQFIVASEDYGTAPLRPTMEELCNRFQWPRCDSKGCLGGLNLVDLLQNG